jgi:tRNA threonylcarbamoyladenosine biosynthesis protein TsaE
MALQITLENPDRTREFGIKLATQLTAGTVLLLHGDLGAGKTSLVQGIGAGLGIKDSIDSPTFTLINEYLDGRIPLYHLDLYRLAPAEIGGLNLEAYWEGVEVEPGIVAIEWPERLVYPPLDYLDVRLSINDSDGRDVVISAVGNVKLPGM